MLQSVTIRARISTTDRACAAALADIRKVYRIVNYFGLLLLNHLLPSIVNYSLMGMYGLHSLHM
jgi:hypothetical protein